MSKPKFPVVQLVGGPSNGQQVAWSGESLEIRTGQITSRGARVNIYVLEVDFVSNTMPRAAFVRSQGVAA